MKTYFKLLFFNFVLITCGNLYTQNLILNPNCETPLNNGEIPNWEEVVGTSWTAKSLNPNPQSGLFYFSPGTSSIAELSQDIDVSNYYLNIDNYNQLFTFDGFVRTFQSDLSRIIIEYRNVTNSNVIMIFDSGEISNTSSWLQVSDIRLAPIGTRFIRIRLISTRVVGTINDGFYDNLSLITNSVLPITYSKPLEATQNQNSTKLSWSVASQINNDKYIIEHSIDGRSFSPSGEIAGDGTNNAERHYTYTHKTPSLGVNYYRIKQIDYDGQYSYSNIASVVYDADGREIAIYPTPATEEVTVSVIEDTEVSVVDMMGRVLKKVTIGKDQNTIKLSEIPSGMFIFVVGDQRYMVLKE